MFATIQRLLGGLRQIFHQNRHAKELDFKLIAENSSDVIIRRSPDGTVNYVSRSVARIFGFDPEDVIGKQVAAFVHPEDLPILGAAQARSKLKEEEDIRSSFRARKADGTWLWVESSSRTIREPRTGELGDTVIVVRDITERKNLENRLEALATTDGLTGLANRRAFDQALDLEWRTTLREGTPLSLLLVDVDHFKSFNDRYGHQVGDDCLRAVAAALRSGARRPGDFVARYGGEEIAIILPATDSAGAMEVAQHLRRSVEALNMTHASNWEGNGHVTVSIGATTALARIGGTIDMPAGLLQAADMALYKAKSKGRNRVETSFLLAPPQGSQGQSAA